MCIPTRALLVSPAALILLATIAVAASDVPSFDVTPSCRGAAAQLATVEQRRSDQAQRRFDQRLTDAKKSLVVVGLGAGVLIVLLLLTASDIARLALEQQASRET